MFVYLNDNIYPMPTETKLVKKENFPPINVGIMQSRLANLVWLFWGNIILMNAENIT